MSASSKLSTLVAALGTIPILWGQGEGEGEVAYAYSPFSATKEEKGGAYDEGGFDPESLERGAKALRQINTSPHAKQVFEVMRKQEQTRLAELAAEKAHFEAIQAQQQIDKQRKISEEQRELLLQQSQAEAQILRYEDKLARKDCREGVKVTWGYINRILGQPSLIRESSIAKFPWSGLVSRGANKMLNYSTAAARNLEESKTKFGNIVLHPSLQRRIENLARATSNTKSHEAPFRNMLFYGPPGTGKTMVAKEIARKSDLDYAMMTGGDVAPLRPQAVTKIHDIFDWSNKSKKGLLLFIDEADAFLYERNIIHISEAQRSALNALLFRTGDQSGDVVLVLATNRPGDLDSAITDRIDEMLEFPLPGEEERFKLY